VNIAATESSPQPYPCPTVLVVDDERGPRLALELILQRDYRVLTAESGEEALDVLRAESVDAVTLDLKMPGLAGHNTLSIIRGIDPDLPVIVITGYGSYESALKALRLRAFDFISKPFESKQILVAIEQAMEARRRHRAHDPQNVIEPLEAVLDATDRLERAGTDWLTNPDRAVLESIRFNVRTVQEQFRARLQEYDPSLDLFGSR
jgi:FixJ family two-component response regulator